MGLFNRLSTFFTRAPQAEIDAVNTALRDVAMQSLIIMDDLEPKAPAAPTFRPNRKQRRAHAKGLRYRDRNTEFGNRSQRVTPKKQHERANDKNYQFACHPILWGLLARGGYNRAVEGGAA